MTGTELFIIALVLILVIFVLLFRALSRGTPGKAKLSFGELFKAEIDLGAADKDNAKKAISSAINQRSSDADSKRTQIDQARAEIDQARTTRVARVLWVDDHPDYNLQETIALEELGLFVTKTTATEAAETYLQNLKFALVITDLGRDNNPNAGLELLEKVKVTQKDMPVIVYTLGADEKRASLTEAGARAVVDTPSDLIAAVLANRPGAN